MTRDEVMKALECISGTLVWCDECPYGDNRYGGVCKVMAARDALALLKAEQRKVDCNAANRDAAGCLGYGYSDNDDEPIDVCKRCEQYTGNAEEAGHDEG